MITAAVFPVSVDEPVLTTGMGIEGSFAHFGEKHILKELNNHSDIQRETISSPENCTLELP